MFVDGEERGNKIEWNGQWEEKEKGTEICFGEEEWEGLNLAMGDEDEKCFVVEEKG